MYNGDKVYKCFSQETSSVDENILLSSNVLLLGDFNFHFENKQSLNTCKFRSQLQAGNLTQHVQVPTHQHGHTLDLVISRCDELGITEISTDMSINTIMLSFLMFL